MINMANEYRSYLKSIAYGYGYDIRVHAAQTALSVLGFITKDSVNKSSIQYGYHCIDTENMLKEFQIEEELPADGIMSSDIWNSIFNNLLDKHKLVVIKTGDRQVSLYDLARFLEDSGVGESGNSNNGGDVPQFNGDDEDNGFDVNLPDYDNDLLYPGNGELTGIYDGGYPNTGIPTIDAALDFITNGGESGGFVEGYLETVGTAIDEYLLNYITSGGEIYNGISYNYNVNGGETHTDERLDYVVDGSANKDYDYIYNLLANSMYKGAINRSPMYTSTSNTTDVGVLRGAYDSSSNNPFFHPSNFDVLRKSKFDIDIVYGAKGESGRRLIEVTPVSVAQELDASGEPIYDLYEFIAKDIVYSNDGSA